MTKDSTIIMALAVGYILGTKSKKKVPVQLQKPCYCPKPGTATNPMLVLPATSGVKPAYQSPFVKPAINIKPAPVSPFSIPNRR